MRSATKLLLIACCTLVFVHQARLGRASQALDSSLEYDFGVVRQGDKVSHTFFVPSENTEATIQRVELNRPGMKAQFSPKRRDDGTVSVTVTWDTLLASGQTGGQAIVRWTEPTTRPTILMLTGTIRPVLEVLPSSTVFFSAYQDQSPEQVVSIVNRDEKPLEIKAIETAGQHFKASVRTVRPGQEYQIAIQVPAGTEPGRYLEKLVVETSSDVRPRLPVGVNVFVKRDVYAFPETVTFGQVERARFSGHESLADLLTQTILVSRRQGPFEIRSVRSDVPGVRVKQTPESGPSEVFRFDIDLDLAKVTPGSLTGAIHVETSDPAFPDLIVPVQGNVR